MNSDPKLHELLVFALVSEADFGKKKAVLLASHFATLDEFLTATPTTLRNIRSVGGKSIFVFGKEELAAIKRLQKNVLARNLDASDNYLILIARHFVRRQSKMLNSLTLGRLKPNPFLIKCLNLKTAREVVELNVYMLATRSIVTSMGFFVEQLLIASSETAERCKKPWDIFKTDKRGRRHWIQVKSGANDMDADQIRLWSSHIAEKISEGDEAYIGTTYGRRGSGTVTLGLFKTYLPDWEKRTLIGKELWDFISDDPNHHEKLFPLLGEAASQILGSQSIEQRIQRRIQEITKEFTNKYGTSSDAVRKYLADIF